MPREDSSADKSSGPKYDPRVSEIDAGILDQPDLDEIRRKAIRFGIHDLDAPLPAGLNTEDGDMVVFQGDEKGRKTTTVLNIVRNICRDGKLKGTVLWETLESGESPRRVKQRFICLEATAWLAGKVWGKQENFPLRRATYARHGEMMERFFADMDVVNTYKWPGESSYLFRLSVLRTMGMERTPMQQRAIDYAEQEVNKWPLLIYGAPHNMGGTKRLEVSITGGQVEAYFPYARWKYAIDNLDAEVIVVDHSSAYTSASAYDRQMKYMSHAAAVVAQEQTVLLSVTQTSMSSNGKVATGGKVQVQEGNIAIETEYIEAKPGRIKITPVVSRNEPPMKMYVPVEMHSGLIFPMSYPTHAKVDPRREYF